MKKNLSPSAKLFLANWQHSIAKQNLALIAKSLGQLSDEEIWWRPNSASNSAGNLVLHLCGNARQWIISGLGGAEFQRERDLEFSEQGPIPREVLLEQLRRTVREACRAMAQQSDKSLSRKFTIQGYHVSGLEAAFHVAEHFGYHAGQIVYITKLKRSEDLKFTNLPPIKPAKKKAARK